MQKFKSKNYNQILEKQAWFKNPDWETLLKEILQNIPFSETLRNVLVKITKLKTPSGKDFLLEVMDDDYGCLGDTYEKSLLKEETKDGFDIDKLADNRNGQGTQNMPNKTEDGKVVLEMKRDGICTRITMTGDEDRSRIHETISAEECVIKSPSGFYIKLKLQVPSKKKKISTPENVVDLYYNLLRKDLSLVFKTNVNVKLDLIGFDNATTTKYKDKNKLQALKSPYYIDESNTDTTDAKPFELTDVRIVINTNGDEISIPHINYGKRVGLNACIKKFDINQEQHETNYEASEYGDKPRIRLISQRTFLPYWEGTFPNSGKSNRNGADIDLYFDMGDEIWSDGALTKNPFIQKGGLIEEKLIEKALEIWEAKYPSETDGEDALHKFSFDKFTKQTLPKSVKSFFEGIPALKFLATCNYKKRLQHIKKESMNGHNRFDFSFRDEKNRKIAVELKPKPFKRDEYRQVLDYYISTEKGIKDVIMIGCDVDIEKITDFNDIVKTWKKGKMDSDATFTYVDAVTEFDYDSVQKAAYIKIVQNLKKPKKKNNSK